MASILFALSGLHRVIRGAETAFEAVAHEIAQIEGHKVTLIGSGPQLADRAYDFVQIPCTPRERFEKYPSLPTLRTHYEYEELSFAKNLFSVYEPHRYDLTVACSWPWTHWLLRERKTAGYRPKHVFVTENGDYMVRAQRREYSFFGCDGLICTNHEYYERNSHRFPAVLIPNGVDPAVFTPEGVRDRAYCKLPEGKPVALMVSALIGSKRIPEGIRAAARIPNLHLIIAGDGELREEVRRLGKDLMGDRFQLVQLPRKDMPGLYRVADVFLHMSIDEPSANVYLEALATGLPIVTHDRAVTRWTLEDQAVLVDTEDSQTVTRAIERALAGDVTSNPDTRRALAARRFSWKALAEDYSTFFKEVLAGRATTRKATPPTPAVPSDAKVGAVLIGRNEGERLRACLNSLVGRCSPVVYVDSGSTDGSLELARSMDVPIVDLDTSTGFTAARARNAGIRKLLELAPETSCVQVIDGDCELRPEFLPAAVAALDADPKLAAVCGRRRERHPDASVYNSLTDMEWDTPVGPAKSVGGDALFRVTALTDVGYYNPSLIAGEEPEMCVRLRAKGWRIERLPLEMTLHDAAMYRFSQWWKRSVRAGHAYAEGFALHGSTAERFRFKECRSILFWAGVLPVLILILMWPYPAAAALLVLLYPLLAGKVYLRKRQTWPARESALYAAFTVLGKLAQLEGMLRYAFNRVTNRRNQLIEYKGAQPSAAGAGVDAAGRAKSVGAAVPEAGGPGAAAAVLSTGGGDGRA